MSNYKIKFKIGRIAAVVLFLFMLTGVTWSKDKKIVKLVKDQKQQATKLTDRVIKVSGDGKLVSVYDYFQAIMKQVGGNIAIQSRNSRDIRAIKLLRNFVKGQKVRDLVHNFCLVYRGFDYKIEKDVANIYYDKSVILKNETLNDYSFGKGTLYLSLDFAMAGNGYGSKLPRSESFMEATPEFAGGSISGEYFLGKHFAVALGLLFTDFDNMSEYQTYLTIDPRVTYHYTFLGMHTYLGVGLGYIIQYGDKGAEKLLSSKGKEFDRSLFLTFRGGFLFRIYKRMHLKFEAVLVNDSSFMPNTILGFTYKW